MQNPLIENINPILAELLEDNSGWTKPCFSEYFTKEKKDWTEEHKLVDEILNDMLKNQGS